MVKEKISILGCGWLGKHLGVSLAQKGLVVYGSTTSKENFDKLNSVGITPFQINLNDLINCNSEFFNSEILIISVTSKDIPHFRQLITNIELSSVQKILFVSSTSVYDNSNRVVTEETEVNKSPLSLIEKLFLDNKKFKTIIIRFGGLFGYDRNPANFYTPGREIANPEGFVNLIHRDNCVSIIEKIILKDTWGEIYNACADSHPTRRDFYTNEIKKQKLKMPIFDEVSRNAYKIVSSEKLKSALNYKFKYPDLLNY